MTTEQRDELEVIGTRLEEIARSLPAWNQRKKLEKEFYGIRALLSAAWDIKQVARNPYSQEDINECHQVRCVEIQEVAAPV